MNKFLMILFLSICVPVAKGETNIKKCENKIIEDHHCCKTEEHASTKLQYAFSKVNIQLWSTKQFGLEEKDAKEKENSSWPMIIYFKRFMLFGSQGNKVPEHLKFLKFSPYQSKTLCISPYSKSSVKMEVKMQIELYFFMLMIIGTTLFFAAEFLSKSVKFHYSFSVGFGVICSLLLFVLILSRLVPKKPVAYSILIGGWSLCAWLFNTLWANIETAILDYKWFLLGYAVTMGFISFAICYWYGPVENVRTKSLIKWGLQFIAVVILLFSCQRIEISLFYIQLLIFAHLNVLNVFPGLWTFLYRKYLFKIRWFKEERRFLTEEEFAAEGEEETRKALEELKQFCNSPQCSPWKTLRHLKNPKKFASFVDGDSHIDSTEMSMYEEDFKDEDDEESNISSDEESLPPENINSTNSEIDEKEEIEKQNIEIDWNDQISEDDDSLN